MQKYLVKLPDDLKAIVQENMPKTEKELEEAFKPQLDSFAEAAEIEKIGPMPPIIYADLARENFYICMDLLPETVEKMVNDGMLEASNIIDRANYAKIKQNLGLYKFGPSGYVFTPIVKEVGPKKTNDDQCIVT